MQSIVPHLMVPDAVQAAELYCKAFGGEVKDIHRAGDMPGFPSPDSVIHLHLETSIGTFFLADSNPSYITVGNNVQVTLNLSGREELDRVFAVLKEGGKVQMEPQDTFWNAYYASLTDKFGVSWQFNFQNVPQ